MHLDDAVSVANAAPYPDSLAQHLAPDDRRTLVDGPKFVLVQSDRDLFGDRQRWVIPIDGEVLSGSETGGPGDCFLLEAGERIEGKGRLLIGATA